METDGERKQTVVFLRHGVAKHNIYDERTGQAPNLRDPRFFDPPLIARGKVEAVQAGEAIGTWWHTTQAGEQIELIVTSPLTRCIQTTLLAFLPGSDYTRTVPIMCIEKVRESYGMHFPDRRRDKSLLEKNWPMVSFDPQMSESDEWWRPNKRESWDDIHRRVRSFLNWLVRRSEENIVVVSHGVWIESCLVEQLKQDGGRRVYNCDAFACEAVSLGSTFVRFENVRRIHGTT